MKHLMKGIRIAAYIAEIIVAGSTIVELVEKYGGRSKRKSAASKVDTGNVATETHRTSSEWIMIRHRT